MKLRLLLIPTSCVLLAGMASLALQVSAAPNDGWRTAITAIKAAGFKAVEEVETTTFGGFEAEVFDATKQGFELKLDSKGVIQNRRQEAGSSGEERMDIEVALRLVGWLEAQGYKDIRSISADDGHIEVEAQNNAGEHLELDIEATASDFKLLRSERD